MLDRFDCDSRIFTNASFIHRQLDALSRFRRVCVSFDGAEPRTFEAQRRGARFEQVVRNVALLRAHAPSLHLAFSVVVSRLNLDELANIARLAGELGVNDVAFSPVWHIGDLALRESDRPQFDARLAEAREIGRQFGVCIQNNVGDAEFLPGGAPLDKDSLIRQFSALPSAMPDPPDIDVLARRFAAHPFRYHPDPALFPGGAWPRVDAVTTPSERASESPWDLPIDIDEELARLRGAIARLQPEFERLGSGPVALPYCLSVFKYSYVKASGKNRLCPQYNLDVGNVTEMGFRGVVNSDSNRAYRRSLFSAATLQDVCRACSDPYRWWGSDSLLQFVSSLGWVAEDRTRTINLQPHIWEKM